MFITTFYQKTLPLQRHVQIKELHRNMSVLATSLKYSKYGKPVEVLEIVEDKFSQPKEKEVLVKILAAPINPSDVITIQGHYPVRPKLPAVGGNECVGEVVSVGEKVTNLKVGQRVVPFVAGLGTWRTHGVFAEDELIPISNKIGLAEAATITVNPCTAYRMLKDFVSLREGDCIIQNGANSAVGQAVHQLCSAWNLKSVGIVRDRADIGLLKQHLKDLGATEILTEEEIRTSSIFKKGNLPKPRLALNCVGGKSATEVTRHLSDKGIMVTYGSMALEPVVASTASLIFKDIAFRGFWLTSWIRENVNSPELSKMFTDLSEMIEQGKFVGPAHEMVPLKQFKNAIEASMNSKGFNGKKFILDMQ